LELIISLFLGAIFIPLIFPNFLNIDFGNHDLIIKLFSNISVILASIFGIIIAIFLISFQIFKRNYVSYSIKDFFKDPNISFLFLVYLSTILISYFSLTFIMVDYYSNKIVNLYYLSLILFLICISILYHFIKLILTSDYSNNRTKEVISKLKYEQIVKYFEKYDKLFLGEEDISIDVDKNPHLFLDEMFISAVKRKDGIAIKTFYNILGHKIMYLLEKSKNPEEKAKIFEFFREIYIDTAQVAINQYEKSTLEAVLNSLFPIYLFCIDNNIIGESIKILDKTIEEILLLIIESNNVLPIRFPIFLHGIKSNILDILKKYNKKHDVNPARNQMQIIFNITDRAIEIRKENFAKEGLCRIIDIIYEVIEEINIQKPKKPEIVEACFVIYKHLVFKMVDRGLFDIEILIYSFHSERIFNTVKKNIDFSNQILMLYCETLLELADKNILNEFPIENLGQFGKKIILQKNDIKNSDNFILYIFNVLNRLRGIIEKSKEMKVSDKFDILYKQIEDMKEMIEYSKRDFTQIIEEITSIYTTFKNVKPYHKKQYKTLDWPNRNK
jgi:hypothetical protein